MQRLKRKAVSLVVIIGLFVAIQPVYEQVEYERVVYGYAPPTTITKVLQYDAPAMTGVIVGAMLGGFREIAASMMWMKTRELWHKGSGTQWDALSLMRMTTLLDPHWLQPWRITAWHCAYNLFVETDDPEERAFLLETGVNCLKEGISWNPDRYDLYFELGWTFFDKIRDYEQASRWLEASLQFEHPEYIERLIAHSWERLPEIDRSLEWYDYCIKRRPNDHTAAGATITIRERYLPTWRLMNERRFDEAHKQLNEYIAINPTSTIALHLKALLYERAGDYERALAQWQMAADSSALNAHARSKVAYLSERLGREVPLEPSYLYRTRVAEQAGTGQRIVP
jgi:tetratricopeptide (TPR) repeat protein